MATKKLFQRKLKRALDIAGAGVGLVLCAPVMALAAGAIWSEMGRPILFRQERPGLNGQTFTIFKFRTMVAAPVGDVWFRTDAQRLTRLGAFLRKTSIDELPELLNVLIGTMSLVGPRPLLLEYWDKYTPEERRRHETLPGITGWAQINGRQRIKFSERLQLDVWYVDNWSLSLDLKILALTVLQVFKGEGVLPGQNVDDVDDIGLSADRARIAARGAER